MLTAEEVKGLKVPELKEECKNLGLSIKGNKPDLVKRLEDAIAAQGETAATETSNEPAANGDQAAAPVAVTVETEGAIPPEIADQVVETATAALENVEVAKQGADEVIEQPVVASATEGEPVVTEQVTTVTEVAPGEYTIETQQDTIAAPGAALEGAAAEPEAVTEAVAEAVDTAVEASEATDQPAVVEAVIDGATAGAEEAGGGATATPMETTEPATAAVTETVATAGAPAIAGGEGTLLATGGTENGSAAGDSGQTRLFVGCVPFQFSEDDLKAFFEPVGALKDISILRDHNTGLSRGCAFAVYEDQVHAEAAIDKLDKKLTLPGASQLIEVRFAKNTNKVQPTAEPNDKNQLFFARAPIKATETEIRDVFAEFGEVTDVALFMNRQQGFSKGCGFISFKERSAAESAIANLNEKRTMPSGFAPLTVKWSDPNLTEKKRKAAEELNDPNRENNQIFFARIPNTIVEDELKEVFSKAGSVKEVVLFKTHASATINKRCGIVTYYSHEDAARALETLHETHTFPGMDLAMVLKWVDQDLQKRRKMGQDGPGGPMFGGPPQWGAPAPYGAPQPTGEEPPPPGCDRDAIKLFLSGVPKTWEVPELKKALEEFGTVVECNLVRDKITKEPRGVAFAWLKSKFQGERAIRDLNNRQLDHGALGQKPVSVSKARPRRPSVQGYGAPGYQPPGQAPYGRSPGGYQGGYGARPQPAPYQQPYYPQGAPAYDPYAQPQQAQQATYTYQPQQAAPTYGGYQAQAAPAQTYQAPAASSYQQTYNPPQATYGAPAAAASTTPAYGTAQGYDTTGQTQYSAPPQSYSAVPQQTYAAPATSTAATQQTGGYNYGTQTTATNTASQPAQASQYSYSAPSQTYTTPSEGYNYSLPQN